MNKTILRLATLPAAVNLVIAASAIAADQTDTDPAFDAPNVPVVLTATRLKQSVTDTPASVSVITADMIHRYGIRSVVDAMRLVPGMEVNVGDGNSYIGNAFQVSYHGTNGLDPRRMNVMIDGVTMYQPAFSEVKWDTLPVSIDDVDRIEVVRGSNSAAYGPNSMMAVINIITRHPADAAGGYAAAEVATNDQKRYTLRFGSQIGDTHYRVTAEHVQAGGFSSSSNPSPIYSTDTSTNRVTFAAKTRFSDATDLSTSAALWNGHDGVARIDPQQISPSPINMGAGYLAATLRSELSPRHELSLRAYLAENEQTQRWSSAYPEATLIPQAFAMYQANPAYADAILQGKIPTGGSAQDNVLALQLVQALQALGPNAYKLVNVEANQNFREQRLELEAQDTYVASSDLRAVWGAGARYNVASSDTYFGGSVSNYIYWLFGNAEYHVTPHVTLNVGGYGETGRLTGANFSPRVAINAKLDDLQTLRFVVSQGTRTPDLHEQRSNWTYTAGPSSDPAFVGSRLFLSAVSTQRLSEEKEDSAEIGYTFLQPRYGLTFDARAFYEHLHDLISEQLSIGTFNPTNNGHVDLSGVELQLSANPSPDWGFFATYAYLENDSPATSLEHTQYARNSGSLGVTHRLADQWRVSLDYARQSSEAIGVKPMGRVDLTLLGRLQLGRNALDLAIGVSHADLKSVSTTVDATGVPANPATAGTPGGPVSYNYSSQWQVLARAGLSF